jgi:hypothetical protein
MSTVSTWLGTMAGSLLPKAHASACIGGTGHYSCFLEGECCSGDYCGGLYWNSWVKCLGGTTGYFTCFGCAQ